MHALKEGPGLWSKEAAGLRDGTCPARLVLGAVVHKGHAVGGALVFSRRRDVDRRLRLSSGRLGSGGRALSCGCCPVLPQEPKTDQDEEHCRKVNEYLNNPPMPGALGASGSGGHELSALGGMRPSPHVLGGPRRCQWP